MISMMMYDADPQEGRRLIDSSRDAVAHLSEEQLVVANYCRLEPAREEIQKGQLLDVAFLDMKAPGGVELSKLIRQKNETAQFLVIADMTISPMTYMTPDIRAASLLLRPFTDEVGRSVVRQFFRAVCREQESASQEKRLVIENREGRIAIPYSKIYYLEVRGKKVYIRLKEKEYSKYDTMENIIQQLPEGFIRSHRSYVVNSAYITRVKLSENVICLEDDIMVPLARSYKADLKDLLQQTKE